MRDAQGLLRAKGLHPIKIERTEPQEGHYYFQGHRVVRMGDPLPIVAPLTNDTAPTCEAVQRAPLWHFALAGAGIGVLIVLYIVGVL